MLWGLCCTLSLYLRVHCMANKKGKYMNYSNCENVFRSNSYIRNTSVKLLNNLDLLFNR